MRKNGSEAANLDENIPEGPNWLADTASGCTMQKADEETIPVLIRPHFLFTSTEFPENVLDNPVPQSITPDPAES